MFQANDEDLHFNLHGAAMILQKTKSSFQKYGGIAKYN